MNTAFKYIISQTEITENQWLRFVEYLQGDLDLSLATRIFYLTNLHSTHTFDYLVPEHLVPGHLVTQHPQIAEYLSKAKRLIGLLSPGTPKPEDWYRAAQLAGSFNLRY